MVEVIFEFSFFLIIYIYIGYPVLVFVVANFIKRTTTCEQIEPNISIIITAYNEESVITETIENKLSLGYPRDKMEIIVVSDGSTDNTDKIISKFIDRGVRFIRQNSRQGKTAAVNKAVAQATGEIIIFSDANSIYDHDAIKYLVSRFSNTEVGYVTGKMVYMNPEGSLIGDGCSAYMKYENHIRKYESRFNSVIGVDGGIDAMRKDLYEKMNPEQLPDFVQPLHIMKKGYRVVYEPMAILKEQALKEQGTEYRMRVRVSLRSLWALFDMRSLLNPLRYPIIGWQLISHKLLRYFAWIPLIIIPVLNLFLLNVNSVYMFIFIGLLLFYSLAYGGFLLRSRYDVPFYFTGPYYFSLLNVAAADACLRFLKGQKMVLWNPRGG